MSTPPPPVPLPPAYATVDQFRTFAAYLGDVIDLPGAGNDVDVAGLLARSSRDLEGFLAFPVPADPPDPEAPLSPLRITNLTRHETVALAQACCCQAAYRLVRDESDLAEGTPGITSVAGVTFAATAPSPIGPETFYALAGCPSLWWHRSGTVLPEPEPTTWIDPETGVTVSMPLEPTTNGTIPPD